MSAAHDAAENRISANIWNDRPLPVREHLLGLIERKSSSNCCEECYLCDELKDNCLAIPSSDGLITRSVL